MFHAKIGDEQLPLLYTSIRGVVPGVGMPGVPKIFADQLTLSQPGGKLCPPNNTGTPGFSDLPTALITLYNKGVIKCKAVERSKNLGDEFYNVVGIIFSLIEIRLTNFPNSWLGQTTPLLPSSDGPVNVFNNECTLRTILCVHAGRNFLYHFECNHGYET